MKIIHIASELAPVAKVGGLGDVIQGLSKALLSQGHEVEVILPGYRFLDIPKVVDGIPVRTIDIEGEQMYGCPNDATRFAEFTKQASESLGHYDVVHLHDWHTAIGAALLPRTLLTIHNLAYLGTCDRLLLDRIGLHDVAPLRQGDAFSLLQGGIHFADHVTTVSPTYAKEIRNDPMIKPHRKRFSGILNGIDTHYWNPQTDTHLPHHYSMSDLAGKRKMQQEVQRRFQLEEGGGPIVGAITRLVPQKSPDLIRAALLKTRELGGQFILLGSALDQEIQRAFEELKQEFAEDRHVHLELSFDEALSHQIFAAADLFIVPSRFEPCGLTQMVAMRYGAVPLVRQTGGLADTVFEKRNGFLFKEPTPKAMTSCLERAFTLYRDHPERFLALQRAGMQEDFSWERAASDYLNLYRQIPF